MLVRAARTLALSPTQQGVEGVNFLHSKPFTVDASVLAVLSEIDDWTDADELEARMNIGDDLVADLLGFGLLIDRDSPAATREAEYEREWQWGLPAAALHFSLHDRAFTSVERSEVLQVEKMSHRPQPPCTRRNDRSTVVSQLPTPDLHGELLGTMARRRTVRESSDETLSLAQLSSLLFSGLGITGQTSNAAGNLPLKMTPSGGARNPYEGYVYARRVRNLRSGVYHYSGMDHTLGLVNDRPQATPAELVADQAWADEAAAVIILIANLDRTMWKYDDPNAYRVVMIEAGHVFQNIMLIATQTGWSACPTAAIARTLTLQALALEDSIVIEPVYALALMKPPGGLPTSSGAAA